MHDDPVQGILFSSTSSVDLVPRSRPERVFKRMRETKNLLPAWQLKRIFTNRSRQYYAVDRKHYDSEIEDLASRLKLMR